MLPAVVPVTTSTTTTNFHYYTGGPLLDHVNKRNDNNTYGHADDHMVTRIASYRDRDT